tara:strand:+ start:1985 stop:2194 length:210 start_codon:yes stop_codon:yes gene_type:complete
VLQCSNTLFFLLFISGHAETSWILFNFLTFILLTLFFPDIFKTFLKKKQKSNKKNEGKTKKQKKIQLLF